MKLTVTQIIIRFIALFDFTNFFLLDSNFFTHCGRPIFNFYEERSIQFYAFLLQSYSIHSASYVNSPVQSKNSSFWASLESKPIYKVNEKYYFYQCTMQQRRNVTSTQSASQLVLPGGMRISVSRVIIFFQK